MLNQEIAKILNTVNLHSIFDSLRKHKDSRLLKTFIDLLHYFNLRTIIDKSIGTNKISNLITIYSILTKYLHFLLYLHSFYLQNMFESRN